MAAFFTSHVGTGSRSQCFGGTFLSNAMISSVVTAWKADKLDVARDSTSATGALAVARTHSPWLWSGWQIYPQTTTRWRWLVVASTVHSLATTTLECRVYSLWLSWSRTGLEHHSLMCKLLAPGREWLICRWILLRWRVLIFSKWHSALYQRADEETARMLDTLSEAWSSTCLVVKCEQFVYVRWRMLDQRWSCDVLNKLFGVFKYASSIWCDEPIQCVGKLLDWLLQWWLSVRTLFDQRRLTVL